MEKILASFVIAVQQDKILLVEHKEESRHPTGVYTIPGGEIDAKEFMSLQENQLEEIARKAAIRETKEETGLDVNEKNLQFVDRYDITVERKEGIAHPTIFLYFCKTIQGELKEGKETKPLWGDIDSFLADGYLFPRVSSHFLKGIKKVLRTYLKTL